MNLPSPIHYLISAQLIAKSINILVDKANGLRSLLW
jgi:hypothetical protein